MRKVLIGLLIAGLLVLLVTFLLSQFSFSDGDRAGTITKFSRKGFVFKTYEGELLQGGVTDGTGAFNAEKFLFSVSPGRDSVTKKIEMALLNGQRVRLHYEEKYFRFFWMGDSKYYITEVDFAR